MELTDEIRRTVEALKTFDIPHELRMVTEEHKMGCPGAENRDEVLAEKLKAFHGGLIFAIEKLFDEVVCLEAELNARKEMPSIDQTFDLLLNEEYRLNMISQTEPDIDNPAVHAGDIVYIDLPATDIGPKYQ